jgi:hypothetical protein
MGGVCQAFQLVGQQPHPLGIAVTPTSLYWAGYGAAQIVACSLSDCAGSLRIFVSNMPNVGFLAVDSADLFWTTTTTGGAWECSFTNCNNPLPIYRGMSTIGIATDGTQVYWADQQGGGDGGLVAGCDVSGQNPKTIAANLPVPVGVGVGPTGVYWTNSGDGTLWGAPLDGGAAAQLGSSLASPMWFLKLDTQRVYWAGGDGVHACPLAGCGPGDANLVSFGGIQQAAFDVAVDAKSVYWTEFAPNGRVLSCPLMGCGSTPKVLFQNGLVPANITVDSAAIYWTVQNPSNESAGAVWRLAK